MAKITFYNIPSKIDTWSGSVAKVKYLLDANHVSYDTVSVPFNKIGETLEKYGVKPNDQAPFYTLPAITIKGETITDSTKIVDYLVEHHDELVKEGILPAAEFKAYHDIVDSKFVNALEKTLYSIPALKTLLYEIILAYEVELLNDEDQKAFIESRLVKGVDILALRNQPKDKKQIWDDAIKALNVDLRNEFQFEGLDRSKFLTGDFVYGDQFTWADIILFLKFDHYKELASANAKESLVPETGLVASEWFDKWTQRVRKIINH